jgi:hypothetical protein
MTVPIDRSVSFSLHDEPGDVIVTPNPLIDPRGHGFSVRMDARYARDFACVLLRTAEIQIARNTPDFWKTG